jgi:NAD(P)H-hydrate epimerase
VKAVLENAHCPVVLDADGINVLSRHKDILRGRKYPTILTPHDGEFTRIAGGVPIEDRMISAAELAKDLGCILVLKGHRTIIATPEGNVLVNTTGNSGLAKGGTGDVLTGMIAALLAQGATPVQAAAAGVWMHGRAGDLAADVWTPYAMTPENVLSMLPNVFAELLK